MRTDRVLILTPDFPPAPGGIQLLVHRLAAHLRRFDPMVVSLRINGSDEFDRASSVRTHRVSRLGSDQRVAMLALNAGAIREARRFAPDIVLSAHIVTSPAAAVVKRQLHVPIVQYLHANEVGMRPGLARFAVRTADATIAVSRHTCGLARQAGAVEESLHRIPPGVDLPARKRTRRRDRPTIVTVARLEDRYKGHDMILRALPLVRARVPDVEWIVIGDGSRRPQLERLAEIYGVSEQVRFVGQVTNDQRDQWLEHAHVFAMPSRLPGDGLGGEGFGIVYLEAAWRELPVVAGDAGGAVDAVADGETGVLVDANDSVAVADALIEILANRELAERMGASGARRAEQFAWPLIAERVEDVATALLEGSGSPQTTRA